MHHHHDDHGGDGDPSGHGGHNDHGGHDGHGHDHPATFLDLLARHDPPEKYEEAVRAYHASSRSKGKTEAKLVRRDQAALSSDERAAFKDAVTRMCKDSPTNPSQSTYGKLVAIHGAMADGKMVHRMHSSSTSDAAGSLRFLPWHRRFLLEFERGLIKADQALRPNAVRPLGVPYWRLQDDFPAWLDGFFPFTMDGDTPFPAPVLDRAKAGTGDAQKPTLSNIKDVLGASESSTGSGGAYARFTLAIEGYTLDKDQQLIRAHNSVHAWVGGMVGVMGTMMKSPVDPVFWLVHSEVDRLWDVWSDGHPGVGPSLKGKDAVMDPWDEKSDDLLDTTTLGYTYDSDAP